jgi:hypothetical protein
MNLIKRREHMNLTELSLKSRDRDVGVFWQGWLGLLCLTLLFRSIGILGSSLECQRFSLAGQSKSHCVEYRKPGTGWHWYSTSDRNHRTLELLRHDVEPFVTFAFVGRLLSSKLKTQF